MVARSGKNAGRRSNRAIEFNREDLNRRDKKGNSLDRGNSMQSGVEAGTNTWQVWRKASDSV